MSTVRTSNRPSSAGGAAQVVVPLSTLNLALTASANATAINAAISAIAGFDVTLAPTGVAAPSNGINLATFAGAGTLDVVNTAGRFDPTGGTAVIGLGYLASPGTAIKAEITYTGITATQLTGCTLSTGSGVLTTGDQVYAMPTGSGVVELGGSTEELPFMLGAGVIVCDGIHIKGAGFGRTWLKQFEGSNLDAMIAGYYWWHNCTRYLSASSSSNGQKYVRISDLSLDANHRDWTHNTTLSAAIADTVTTTISFASRQTVSGRTIVVDGEFITVPTTASTGAGTIAGCTRNAFGSIAATHASGAKVAIVRNMCTTNPRAATIVGDGHAIAIGAPHTSTFENLLIVRPYGHGIFFDSAGRNRVAGVDVGEGIQWRIQNVWVKFPGLDGIHNADAATGKSNVNDGHVINWYIDNVNQLDVNDSAAASGNVAYGNNFVGQYVFDINGGATTYQGGHGYGNYTPAGNRTAFPGSRAKHGIRVESSAARMSDVMIADFGQATNDGVAMTCFGFWIRGYYKRGPALVNCKAHCDLDNPIHTKWLARVQTTNAAGTTTPVTVEGFNGQVRVDAVNVALTTLATTVTDTDTTIVLTSGTGIVAGDVIILDNEAIRLGTKAVNTFTGCTRKWANTAPAAHNAGANAYLNTIHGIQLNTQNAGAIITGALVGCSVTGVAIPFDGKSADASARVAQAGNSWQRAGAAPPTAGAAAKHGYVPAGHAIDNDCSVVTNVARWIVTAAGTTDVATFAALTLP